MKKSKHKIPRDSTGSTFTSRAAAFGHQHISRYILEETPPTEEAPPVEEAPPADDAPAEEAPVEEVDDRDPNGTWRILKNPGEAKTSEGVNASITIEVGRGEVLHKSGSRNEKLKALFLSDRSGLVC